MLVTWRRFVAAVALLIGLVPAGRLLGADWPMYRRDMARSGTTVERLPFPLYRQWAHVPTHAPKPAWPEPGRELNRLAFDYANQVVAAGGCVYFGSSADHKVTALDQKTGRPRWRFFTGGPVRFAPAYEDGRLFVASDDGWLYCLSADTGKLLWRRRGGPRREMIMGNGQLISRWPLRAGVGVDKGVVHFAAGMWPSEGVSVHAVRAEDGKVLWRNDTSGTSYVRQPHPGSYSMTGVAPQGYVLGRDGRIFVPTGRNMPAAYDGRTGRLLYYRSAPTAWANRWGGSVNFLAGGVLFTWRCHHGPDIDIRLGEYAPDPKDGIAAFDAATGSERRELTGKLHAAVRGNTLYAAGAKGVAAYDLEAFLRGAREKDCTRWQAAHGRAYALVLAGNAVLVGGDRTITAFGTEEGQLLWQEKVAAQVRGLAVSNGRVLVSAADGRVVCFSQDPPPAPVPSSVARPAKGDPVTARRILDRAGRRDGYAVLYGSGDGQLREQLARQSRLRVWCLEPDASKVDAARKRLDAAGLYGVRVVVHHAPPGELAYPDYFAELIVLPGHSAAALVRRSAAEVYRILRPTGGRLFVETGAPGVPSSADVAAWLRKGGVPASEIRVGDGAVQVVRGALPGAGDWTHQYANAARTGGSDDTRVRLPVKLLWFGEPGPERLISRHWGGPSPLYAGGRMFVIGQFSLTAVDAYNGRSLWRRDFPSVGWWPVRSRGSSAAADGHSVYLVVKKQLLRLDAATGKTVRTYAMPEAPAEIPQKIAGSLAWTHLAVDGGRIFGSMGGRTEARCLFALDKDGKVLWTYVARDVIGTNAMLTGGGRVYLMDRTSAATIRSARRSGRKLNIRSELIALDAATGKAVWRTAEGLDGRTEMWMSDGVILTTGGNGMTGYRAADGRPLYARKVRMRRFPVIARGTVYAEPGAYDLQTGQPRQRTNLFSGEKTNWTFQRSYGCGAISAGTNLLMFRSGTLGMYDLAGDSGVFNFGGVRAGCYVNAIAAGGLVLAPPADAGCTCSYSYQTTVALMPVQEHHLWSIFYDELPAAPVRRGTFNVGAPGDRRDAAGGVWLAVPRPRTTTGRPAYAAPFRATVHEGFGPYRHAVEATEVAGAERPWLYANGLKGLRRLELDVEIHERGMTAWPTDRAAEADGRLDESCWDGYRSVDSRDGKQAIQFRYDHDNLYVGFRRDAPLDRKSGGPRRWRADTRGRDAQVWRDDSFEVYLSNTPLDRRQPAGECVHFGLSPSGARYEAAWAYVGPQPPTFDVGAVRVTVDGNAEDWGDKGLVVRSLPGVGGKMRAADDFDPSLRFGWNADGLALLADVTDSVVRGWDKDLARADTVEIRVARTAGSRAARRCVLAPPGAVGRAARCILYDVRGKGVADAPAIQVAGRKTAKGYRIEALVPWAAMNVPAAAGGKVAVHLSVVDDDGRDKRNRFRAQWPAVADPAKSHLAWRVFHLAPTSGPAVVYRRGKTRDRTGLYSVTAPHWPLLGASPLGDRGEDAAFNGDWMGAAKADRKTFVAEMTIPWKTLVDAGVKRDRLMVNVAGRGPLRQPPRMGQGFERLVVIPESKTRPRPFTVRLHFAEMDDVRPGERVFDVKLQGKVVLKGFDVVSAAGAQRRAIVKEFRNIEAGRAIVLEMVAKADRLTARTAPILSAVELIAADAP
jgi:outer membrane protein assembly factor BamB